jgi:hypothetical protein
MRADEVSLRDGRAWSKKRLSRWHLRWRIAGRMVFSPTAEQLSGLREGDMAILIPPASKADPWGLEWGPNPIYLRYAPSERVCAARELAQLELEAPCHGERRRTMPLFADHHGSPLATSFLRSELDARLRSAGFTSARVERITLHSFRVYLACALLELGRTRDEIMALLRWRSDEALRVYARLNAERYAGLLHGVGDATIDQTRAHNLPTTDVFGHIAAVRSGGAEMEAEAGVESRPATSPPRTGADARAASEGAAESAEATKTPTAAAAAWLSGRAAARKAPSEQAPPSGELVVPEGGEREVVDAGETRIERPAASPAGPPEVCNVEQAAAAQPHTACTRTLAEAQGGSAGGQGREPVASPRRRSARAAASEGPCAGSAPARSMEPANKGEPPQQHNTRRAQPIQGSNAASGGPPEKALRRRNGVAPAAPDEAREPADRPSARTRAQKQQP